MGLGYPSQPRPPGRLPSRRRAACALLALAALGAPGQALAQNTSDSQTVQAEATILDTGTMANLADMDFGRITRPLAAGTVTMTASLAPTCTVTPGIIRSGPCQPARFAVMGRKNWVVRIREQNSGTITLAGRGGASMTVTNLTIGLTDMVLAPGGGNPPGTFGRYQITSDSGVAEFRIAGRLNMAANQAVGIYTGTLNMQVIFN